MNTYLDFASFAFVVLFFIIDPLGNVPIFLSITQHDTAAERRRIVTKATIASFCILSFFLIAGGTVLQVLHITVGAFRIAGGILIFIISLQMLFHLNPGQKTSPQEQQEAVEKEDVSMFPLAIPLLSGPGAIAAIIMLRSSARTMIDYSVLLIVLVVLAALTYGILRSSEFLMRWLGQTGVSMLTRLMGLILSVISVQFIIDGIKDILPDLLQAVAA